MRMCPLSMCLQSGLIQPTVFICLYTYQFIYWWSIYSSVDVVHTYIFGWFYFLPHKWSLLDPIVSDSGDLSLWSHSLMTHNGALPSLVSFSQLTCLWMSPASNIMWAGEPDYALSGFLLKRWWWWWEHHISSSLFHRVDYWICIQWKRDRAGGLNCQLSHCQFQN